MKVKKMACPKCHGAGKVDDLFSVGAELRQRRNKLGLSLRFVANSLGVSAPYISDLERGNRAWRQELIRNYESILSAGRRK